MASDYVSNQIKKACCYATSSMSCTLLISFTPVFEIYLFTLLHSYSFHPLESLRFLMLFISTSNSLGLYPPCDNSSIPSRPKGQRKNLPQKFECTSSDRLPWMCAVRKGGRTLHWPRGPFALGPHLSRLHLVPLRTVQRTASTGKARSSAMIMRLVAVQGSLRRI